MLYLISLGAGLLVGIIYSLINVHSPAPPLVALVGLLGMLASEQIIPVGKRLLSGSAFQSPVGRRSAQCTFLASAGPPCRRGRKNFRNRFPGEPLMTDAPDLIVTNPRVTTLDRS